MPADCGRCARRRATPPAQDATNAGNVNNATFSGTTLTINGDFASGTVTSAEIEAAIDNLVDGSSNPIFTASGGTATNVAALDTDALAAVNTSTDLDAITGTSGADEVTTTAAINITGTTAAGASGDIDIAFAEAALGTSGPATNVIGNATDGFTVQINSDLASVSLDAIRLAIQGIDEVDTAAFNPGTAAADAVLAFNGIDVGGVDPDAAPSAISLNGGVDQVISNETINITTATGFTDTLQIAFAEANLSGTPTNTIENAANDFTIQIDNTGTVTLDQIRTAIENLDQVASATFQNASAASITFDATADDPPTPPVTIAGAGGASGVNGIAADLVFELAGATGSEVLSFEANTSLELLVSGINAVSDATGVTAAANGSNDGLVLTSSEFGTDAFVDLQVISEGTGAQNAGVFTDAVVANTNRQEGTDVIASVNGITANGDGNDITINTATLDLSATLEAGFTGTANFSIDGGGALFQLGPDVVSNQQARLGISSVNTAQLGGNAGLLFQLGTGGDADLSTDPNAAAAIVEDAINQVTSLRGRLGAFQRTTLDTNTNALNDTLTNLAAAESAIRDADFAEETAALTRAQILVQSGTAVLTIANQNPNNALALLP